MELKELMEAFNFACTLDFWKMATFWTYSLILSYIQLLIQGFSTQKSVRYGRCAVLPLPPMTTSAVLPSKAAVKCPPVCIITGATSGLGAAAAHALSKEGFYVVLVGRSSHMLSKVMSNIRDQKEDVHLKAFEVDLSSFQSIVEFKRSLKQWLLEADMHPSIQLLVNNAGILATSSRLTAEGHDEMMGTNYIGAFSLTKVLLPLLKNSPVPSRIVNISSFTHRNVSVFHANKEIVTGKCFAKLKKYPCAQIYEYSKLCILLFSYELHRQLGLMERSQLVSVITVDPGAVKTNIMREVPSCLSQVAFVVLRLLSLLQSPDSAVASILDAVLAPPETSGVYFFGGKGRTLNSSALSYNIKLSKELWATSEDIFQESQLISGTSST